MKSSLFRETSIADMLAPGGSLYKPSSTNIDSLFAAYGSLVGHGDGRVFVARSPALSAAIKFGLGGAVAGLLGPRLARMASGGRWSPSRLQMALLSGLGASATELPALLSAYSMGGLRGLDWKLYGPGRNLMTVDMP